MTAASRLGVGPREQLRSDSGVTLIELIIVVAIVSILATAAVPITRFQVKRQKEVELRRDLWEMRDAIDHYKDAADKGGIQTKADSFNYPPDLQTLVDGVDVQTKKVRFLRRIPIDPMTHNPDWDTRSMQDDPDDPTAPAGQNVFDVVQEPLRRTAKIQHMVDVHSKSTGTALDGSRYSTW